MRRYDTGMGIPDELDALHHIAHAAGEAILRIYAEPFTVGHKSDHSPVTAADLAAHTLIVEALGRYTPDIPVRSEEDAGHSPDPGQAGARYWLVDPLDGTREFIARNGEFTVNIALIEQGRSVLGAVHAPAQGESYVGQRGGAAWLLREGAWTRIRTRRMPLVPRVYLSRSHPSPALADWLQRQPRHEALALGSSLKFCRIARGEADLYPKLGATSQWDTAAAQCVLEAAGGAVLSLPALRPLQYGPATDLRNPHFVASGDPLSPWLEALAAAT
jgi:3'(2'), 5'-bisphosphate nucleotidase